MQQVIEQQVMIPPQKRSQTFFTVREAAEILKVSPDTVRRMLKRRQLRCVVITERTRRIPLEAINEFSRSEV